MKTVLRYITGENVKELSDDNVDTFLASNIAVPKVMLFSSKETTPVLFKALSNSFKVCHSRYRIIRPANETFSADRRERVATHHRSIHRQLMIDGGHCLLRGSCRDVTHCRVLAVFLEE